jgi:imidazolonepropionase-like amidohydrolase
MRANASLKTATDVRLESRWARVARWTAVALMTKSALVVAATPGGKFPMAPPPPGPPVALVGASLVDVVRGTIVPNAVVIVSGDKITSAGPATSTPIPDAARVVNLEGQWLVPGLINTHVHLASALPGASPADDTNADIVLRMTRAARLALESGVTTVRIVGSQGGTDFALKRAINLGYVPGPRIESSGEVLVPTGGHGNREVNGSAEFADATRDQIKGGATWIKISISGGLADIQGDIGSSPMSTDELKAVLDAAHRNNIKVTAHNGSPSAADEALALGIDGFEHGYFLEHKQLAEMKAKGVWLVPTIIVSQPAANDFFKKQRMPDWYMARVESVSGQHFAMLKDAIRTGVPIALGTDMDPAEPIDGTTSTVREAEYLVEAGMTPLAALRATTSDAARMLRLSDDVGSIEPGHFADIVAVKSNPLSNINALRSINFVMKGGQIVRQP